MTTYTITVKNMSGYTQTYFLFQQMPQVSDNIGTVFTNVYLASTPIKTGTGRAVFTVKGQPYAVCGTSPQPIASPVTCVSSDYESVVLTTTSNQGTNCITYAADVSQQL
jgi:hypothetical protein